jgi:8-oxo-dGTP pyrophosphatase MutT (NUDIX family)
MDNRLLLVNAYPDGISDLWCAPGGGVNPHRSLPDNLIREVHEETGLTISVGTPALVNEFHDPAQDFHQIDIYFRCIITAGQISESWADPAAIVTKRRFFSRPDLHSIRYKPDSLPHVAWDSSKSISYDALETLIR